MTINMAVVGLGAFGQKHLDALQQIDDVTIAYVGHSKMPVAEEVAAKYGAKKAKAGAAAKGAPAKGKKK